MHLKSYMITNEQLVTLNLIIFCTSTVTCTADVTNKEHWREQKHSLLFSFERRKLYYVLVPLVIYFALLFLFF